MVICLPYSLGQILGALDLFGTSVLLFRASFGRRDSRLLGLLVLFPRVCEKDRPLQGLLPSSTFLNFSPGELAKHFPESRPHQTLRHIRGECPVVQLERKVLRFQESRQVQVGWVGKRSSAYMAYSKQTGVVSAPCFLIINFKNSKEAQFPMSGLYLQMYSAMFTPSALRHWTRDGSASNAFVPLIRVGTPNLAQVPKTLEGSPFRS